MKERLVLFKPPPLLTKSLIFLNAHAQVGFFIFSNLPHRLDPTTLMGYNVIILIFLKSVMPIKSGHGNKGAY